MLNRIYARDATQQALGFLRLQTSYIEPTVYNIKYPDIQYPQLIPVDTSAPEWAKSITYYSQDRIGRAAWFHHAAKDIPIADVTREKFEHGIEMAAIGYRYDLEELGQAMMLGQSLTNDKASAARRAYEEFVDEIAMRGDSDKGWSGLINDPNVTVVTMEADGDGNSSTWDDKTADQVLRDINAILTGVYTASNTVEMADTLLLPLTSFTSLGTRRIPDTTMTILEFIRKNNVYTAQTGQQLMIRAVRGLDVAGSDGGGRMIAYRRDPQVVKMHIPMTHRFMQAEWVGGITFDVPGIFRLGGVEIRLPGAFRYADGIEAPAYE